ncbi:MAG: sigma-70 family RNA polymerase sigma factor [Planctomycetota bacterium]
MRTDAELLTIYADAKDDAAFEELVRRHAPMVYRTALRGLGNPHDAEDASQAVFLVLSGKARSLRKGDLAPWLYAVARNVVRHMIRERARRRAVLRAQPMADNMAPTGEVASRDEALAALDGALEALPAAERQAIVLRYLEGYSQKEAAELAGCPQGTLGRRASTGMERLRRRLAGRGVAIGLGALVMFLEAEADAAVPATLVTGIVSATHVAAAGAAVPSAAVIAKGAMKMMLWIKLKFAAAAVCAAAAVGTAVPVTVAAVRAAVGVKKPESANSAITIDWKIVNAQAAGEYQKPVRPGVPGERPFWNDYAVQFLFPPAFDFKPVAGAKYYRFTIKTGGKDLVFEAPEPWASLTPIWNDLPSRWDKYDLKVEGLGAKGGEVIATAKITIFAISGPPREMEVRSFRRLGGFKGPYGEILSSGEYAASALRCLRYMREEELCQSFKERISTGNWKNPFLGSTSKMMTAAIRGMTCLAKVTSDKAEADEALKIARNAADCMLAMSVPGGQVLEYFPPSYASWKHSMRLNDPYSAGWAYLDLYDLCKDEKYLTAAKQIADTYRKTQLPSGAWQYVMKDAGGEPFGENKLMPAALILYFDRLAEQYGCSQYVTVSEKALKWVIENPVKSYNWEGQFDDVSPQSPYRNHSHYPAVYVAMCFLNRAKESPERIAVAEELLRFAEDQFIIWSERPTVSEQYVCYSPVNGSISQMIEAYMKAHQVTGKEYYLAKAVALANTIVKYQTKEGCYPTWVTSGAEGGWPNCPLGTARTMLEFARLLEVLEQKRPAR